MVDPQSGFRPLDVVSSAKPRAFKCACLQLGRSKQAAGKCRALTEGFRETNDVRGGCVQVPFVPAVDSTKRAKTAATNRHRARRWEVHLALEGSVSNAMVDNRHENSKQASTLEIANLLDNG